MNEIVKQHNQQPLAIGSNGAFHFILVKTETGWKRLGRTLFASSGKANEEIKRILKRSPGSFRIFTQEEYKTEQQLAKSNQQ